MSNVDNNKIILQCLTQSCKVNNKEKEKMWHLSHVFFVLLNYVYCIVDDNFGYIYLSVTIT